MRKAVFIPDSFEFRKKRNINLLPIKLVFKSSVAWLLKFSLFNKRFLRIPKGEGIGIHPALEGK